ncbi:hypothetical protein HanRHA438_Chr07g0304091 [Helianthus annuus]|nr:hypothetical protein HanHA300_Chr07g0241491 [Helianthus annuus]KAJ0563048.1 hypothetical protein HanHA89_Chr07g0258661 [Helianthus annuus]KAJ0728418.1 hypothetical protein HanLR1_Chr07g0241361 [Helianthus annuus]KAJ0731176.1 hypothetical protein HanOQP8_Chr07g0248941 [Helianthus annuus]KAJ0907877.1 hypothetical protein HanRHA438_Chr07g0304091 [Helianthus annuus]
MLVVFLYRYIRLHGSGKDYKSLTRKLSAFVDEQQVNYLEPSEEVEDFSICAVERQAT